MLGAVSRCFSPDASLRLCSAWVVRHGNRKIHFHEIPGHQMRFTDDIKHLDDEKSSRNFKAIDYEPGDAGNDQRKNVEDIKSFLSRQRDCYRIPYDKFAKDRPRQCVFAGTSNKKQFLPADHSGNRRLIPVKVHEENAVVHILENEESSRAYIMQMWAEIMTVYRKGNFSLTLPNHLQRELALYQEEFTPEDYDAALIRDYMENTSASYVCSRMIYSEVLGHPINEMPPKWQSNAINEVIEKIPGWEQVKTHKFELYGTQRS